MISVQSVGEIRAARLIECDCNVHLVIKAGSVISIKGAFTIGSIAWSEPEFDCPYLPPLDCAPILFGSEPWFV